MKDEVMKMNKMKFNKVLLGLTTDGEFVFANVENRDGKFTASFEMVRPFVWDDKEAELRAESLVDSIDNEYKLSLLEDYDCRPSELVEEIASRWDIDELVDISLYPDYIYKDDKEIYFESDSCGQVDVDRYDYEFKVDEKLFSMLIGTWREYHLKEIPEVAWLRLHDLLVTYENIIDDEEQIGIWLEESVYVDIL